MQSVENIICASWHTHNRGNNGVNSAVFDALHELLNGHYVKYNLDKILGSEKDSYLDLKSFQKIFSNLQRKERGIYYTPRDVADYVVSNMIVSKLLSSNKMLNSHKAAESIMDFGTEEILDIVFQKKFLDPTCGSGEFLISVIEWKIQLCNKTGIKLSDTKLIKICATVFGNDIESESIDIAKMRIFFAVLPLLKFTKSYADLAKTLNSVFYSYDFILDYKKIQGEFDYIVGNPPYIEYSKYKRRSELKTSYGNLYADTLVNSLYLLKKDGALGLILPLSYVSTERMHGLRKVVSTKCSKQIILSFADRPDCLFIGAHQKINILIAQKGDKKCQTYTSSYKHWYKNERGTLLNGREIFVIKDEYKKFIPKIGNKIENDIYKKMSESFKDNLISTQISNGDSIYLNMRACFWIKAFSFNPGSNEYKEFKYNKDLSDFVLCLLNSSMFWLYWTIVSDCWHLTKKELLGITIPEKITNIAEFKKLSKSLQSKLEKTKVYVGTKQSEYEYKHKLCKYEIDAIDDKLANIYGFSSEELIYIKNFALKYRIGDSSND